MRARLLGAELASGEVLTFLDCHIECNDGWLEPLLQRIAEDDSVVAVPIISTIAWQDFGFHHSSNRCATGRYNNYLNKFSALSRKSAGSTGD